MLGSITQTFRTNFYSTAKQSSATQNSSTLFSAKNHAYFSEIPQEVLNIVGDFLGKKDVLNKMLPLSKKIFEAVFEERFHLKVPMHNGSFLEIGYKEFLSNSILILKERIENDPMHGSSPLATWTKLHYSKAIMHNFPNSLRQNVFSSPSEITLVTSLVAILFEVFACIVTQINIPCALKADVVISHAHFVAFVLILLSLAFFIASEQNNPQLFPTTEQRNLIAQHSVSAHALKKLPKLERHLEELITLYEKLV